MGSVRTHPCDIMGCSSEQAWPSRQASLQAEQKTARQVAHGTAPGRPSVPGCRLHTAWHWSTGHQALLGSSFTPADTDGHDQTDLRRLRTCGLGPSTEVHLTPASELRYI